MSATKSRQRVWAVLTRTPEGAVEVYGPFRIFRDADKARLDCADAFRACVAELQPIAELEKLKK